MSETGEGPAANLSHVHRRCPVDPGRGDRHFRVRRQARYSRACSRMFPAKEHTVRRARAPVVGLDRAKADGEPGLATWGRETLRLGKPDTASAVAGADWPGERGPSVLASARCSSAAPPPSSRPLLSAGDLRDGVPGQIPRPAVHPAVLERRRRAPSPPSCTRSKSRRRRRNSSSS